MTRKELEALTYRQRLLRVARDAAGCQYARHYGGIGVDLGYLDSTSDERLRTIVRAWFKSDDVDSILLMYPEYQGVA